MEDVLDQARELECECVGVTLHHVRDRDDDELRALAARASDSGLSVLAMGDFVGSASRGDTVAQGVARVRRWITRATAIGSPTLRLASGFYRADLGGQPELIERELLHVVAVLSETADEALASGVRLLLENHSDFSVSEYEQVMDEVGRERVGVFLDLTNSVASLEDPIGVVERLAPYAYAAHVKDYVFESMQQPDGYHRRGFAVHYRYPGEGVAPLGSLVRALAEAARDADLCLTVEGLDNRADVDDQRARLGPSLALLRTLVPA
jgi:sugar phosphate isomerase/epimerase